MTKCNEVVYDGKRHWVCDAKLYTEHSHAEPGGHMKPLPEDATVALDDNDCLHTIDIDRSRKGSNIMTDYSCPTCGGPGVPLGCMGFRYHLRCRDCGMDYFVLIKIGLADEVERFEEDEVPA